MSRMVLFLAAYFCIYGSAHLYLLIKIRRAFYLEGLHYVLLFAVLTFLMLAPINARLVEAQGQWLPAVMLSWVGFFWMGFVFIYLCLALPLDGYHILTSMGQQLFHGDWTAIMLSRRQRIGLVSLITIALMIYGTFEAYQIKPQKIRLETSKISPDAGTLRIVQISDLHIGPMLYPGRLTPIIETIKNARPQILVSTGDLIDGYVVFPDAATAALHNLPASLGKFAITGNHESYAGIDIATNFTQKAGFTLLRNRSVTVGRDLIITGVDDPSVNSHKASNTEAELLAGIPDGKFSLLLKHRPKIDAESRNKIDLQLSGHTHQGQIFPFGWIVALSYPFPSGLHQITPGRHLYTSRGTGTWGPPIRLLAPPEITIIDLVPVQRQANK